MSRLCPTCGIAVEVPEESDPIFCANGHDEPDGVAMQEEP